MENALTVESVITFLLLLIQIPATAILLSRLVKGPRRHPPLQPQQPTPQLLGTVSVVVPTLNEALRISPLLSGLSRQSYEVREIIVVDSNSQDGTPDLVKTAQQQDPRFRLMTDDPLPANWVGRPWALHNGFLHSSEASQWFLGMDADTQPDPGLVASLVKTAEAQEYDLVSLSPQFILQYPGECLLQPALLMTLLYRFDPAGITTEQPERVMANGQCFLCRRSVLAAVSGYTSARSSFCDDVTLARHIAAQGFKVGFLDGAKVLKVRMYEGAVETWKEWGRSLDLKDASPSAQVWGDLWLLSAVQGLPLLVVLSCWLISLNPLLLGLNVFLLVIRFAMLLAIAPSYDRKNAQGGWLFWLSPLADPIAVLRIFISALHTPKEWRGRKYN
ncbi:MULTISPECIES: 2'-O-glycosyltransferase CruG [Cyanophyceae]|uniref:2'-O-glycosyltransferase CruG n=4 Tax=Cyanobacteriota TaxID=1117 RepID=UPI00232E1C33|nr:MULTISPECIES: glycosyltransferase family 2 protein [Cyanophyceae]MDB9357079.1 glycosyltransferase family 2 protein [Nodularia spumigena CS-587/03]MDB9303146.1 glycosyltransferase family 2 protein [Nodularia spumigena CS-591/12]MDB9319942.1 glycosyltransferase family 2 protein [Nodularia spumigena CS-590/01A]MDB9321905.1 glycosyltransferase family 2 protein [Nodularia spumigena CS-591/07A]MDB9331438.1 glycosyltransferase family 2 protein [Nodularia spumigena CS-591/04]